MLWICNLCTTAYSVGAVACPHCGGDDHVDEGAAVDVPAEPSAVDAVKAKPSRGS